MLQVGRQKSACFERRMDQKIVHPQGLNAQNVEDIAVPGDRDHSASVGIDGVVVG